MAGSKIYDTKLKELRGKKRVTQIKLAKEIGVSRRTISEIERGVYNPNLKIALKIAKYFKKRVEYIFELLEE